MASVLTPVKLRGLSNRLRRLFHLKLDDPWIHSQILNIPGARN